MHLLYAVEFTVAGDKDNVYQSLLGHVSEWLNRGKPTGVSVEDLESTGNSQLSPHHEQQRQALWTVESVPEAKGICVEVIQPVEPEVNLHTRVTVTDFSGEVSLRVEISRETSERGPLTPVQATPVYQPGIIRSLFFDSSLSLAVKGQPVDDRYLSFGLRSSVEQLAGYLDSKRRLPVLLIHTRNQKAWDVASVSSRKTIGLARVVTISSAVRNALAALRPQASVPFGGARLAWSDITATGVVWQADELGSLTPEGFRAELMSILAPVSALYRSEDISWKRLRKAVQDENASRLLKKISRAQSSSDKTELIDGLQQQNAQLSEELNEANEMVEYFSQEFDRCKADAERNANAQREADAWRKQYERLASSSNSPSAILDPWDSIPVLYPGKSPTSTYRAIEKAADHAIVFTVSAERSWSRINYPEPDDMLDKLKKLASAATDLYSSEAQVRGHIDDWFRSEHQLNVATQDQKISDNKKIRYFSFEDETYDQTPHVKVRDHVKPNEVGRIHFAFDKVHKRIIVNHVALKLYDNGK